MAKGRPKTSKPKVDDDVSTMLEQIVEELEDRQETFFEALDEARMIREPLRVAYHRNIDRILEKTPELASMLLIDYIKQQQQEKKENVPVNEEKQAEAAPEQSTRAKESLPKVIHLKKKAAFRHARPNEMVFSVNGTPISLEPQRTYVRNFTAVAQLTEVLSSTPKSRSAAQVEDLPEVD